MGDAQRVMSIPVSMLYTEKDVATIRLRIDNLLQDKVSPRPGGVDGALQTSTLNAQHDSARNQQMAKQHFAARGIVMARDWVRALSRLYVGVAGH